MSISHGTALPTSTNSTSAGSASPDALDRWLSPVPDSTAAKSGEASVLLDELADERHELAIAAGRAELQRDPAWLDVLSVSEKMHQRAVVEEVRRERRDQQKRSALAELRRAERERAAEEKLEDKALADRVWHHAAESQRERLTSPAARLADLARTRQRLVLALLVFAAVGVVWGAANVQSILVTRFDLSMASPQFWLAYGVEPLLTGPLMVLMAYQAKLTEWGRGRGWRLQWPLRAVEASLLLAALAVQVCPHLDLGALALIFAVAPLMIAVSMVALQIVAGSLGEILVQARDDVDEAAALDDEGSALTRFVDRMTTVFDAAGRGELGGQRDELGVPSASAIRAHQGCGKSTAITIRKLWSAARA